MDIDEYQEKAGKYQFKLWAGEYERAFGLMEEAGEVAGLFKRDFRGDYDGPNGLPVENDVFIPKLKKELGDVLWYLVRIAADYELKMSDICQQNLDKLEDRQQRNQLRGSGDDR